MMNEHHYRSIEEWKAEGQRLFGDDVMKWRFVCPSCGYIASVQDWIDAGATEGEIAFSCIGRRLGSENGVGDKTGGPCNYAGGGLFRLNPVTIKGRNGAIFEFGVIRSGLD